MLPSLLDHAVEFLDVDETPAILSLRRLCMVDGFKFSWDGKRSAQLVNPKGRRLPITIEESVPYVYHQSFGVAPKRAMPLRLTSSPESEGAVTTTFDPKGLSSSSSEVHQI